jgi:OFA family oxalate/formate antiporter-like MFS transporter
VLAGAISDRIGIPRTLQYFYTLLGLSVLSLVWFGHTPILFCLFVILAALLGGAPFSLYPAAVGAYYGQRYFTTNYGITYTAKAWAGLISGWLSGYLVARFGSFTIPLISVGICSLIAALASHPRLLSAPERRGAALNAP